MLRILIVDDSLEDAGLLQEALVQQQPDLVAAHVLDGEESLRFLQADGAVNLIILDHHLPRMGALELVTHLQQSPGARDRLVVLTSYLSQTQRKALLQAGVLTVEDKPMDWDGYLSLALRLIALCKP